MKMEKNKIELKEIKIYLDKETKEQLQLMAKAKDTPFKTFISESLVQLCDITFLDNELRNLKVEASEIIDKTKKIK